MSFLVYTKATCAHALSVSKRTFDRMRREGLFDVQPIHLTRTLIGFSEDEVRDWRERKKAERQEGCAVTEGLGQRPIQPLHGTTRGPRSGAKRL